MAVGLEEELSTQLLASVGSGQIILHIGMSPSFLDQIFNSIAAVHPVPPRIHLIYVHW